LSPTWKVMGNWIDSRDDRNRCLVGRNVAQRFKLAPGVQIELRSAGVSALETVVGIVEAGGAEDNQIFLNLPEAQKLAGVGSGEAAGKIQLVELSVRGSTAQIDAYARRLRAALPSLEVRPIRELAESEGQLLARIQLLIFSMVVLILVLTTLCVLATMAALAMERREDVGLMKALGGSISRVVNLFLAEAGVLGAVGGLLGYFLGLALSQWIGMRVFGTAISARLDVLPLTVALMIGVALAGALPLRLLGKIRPAVILRGE
jgi:putative ABC transport system permease protein